MDQNMAETEVLKQKVGITQELIHHLQLIVGAVDRQGFIKYEEIAKHDQDGTAFIDTVKKSLQDEQSAMNITKSRLKYQLDFIRDQVQWSQSSGNPDAFEATLDRILRSSSEFLWLDTLLAELKDTNKMAEWRNLKQKIAINNSSMENQTGPLMPCILEPSTSAQATSSLNALQNLCCSTPTTSPAAQVVPVSNVSSANVSANKTSNDIINEAWMQTVQQSPTSTMAMATTAFQMPSNLQQPGINGTYPMYHGGGGT